MGLQPNQKPDRSPKYSRGAWKGRGMTCDPTTPPWKQKPTTDRQTRQGQGELASFKVLFPLPPLEKKVKHWPCSPQTLTPPIAAFVGPPPPHKGWPRGSFSLLFLHFGLLLATPCPPPSFGLRPSHSHSFYQLLSLTRTFALISRASLPQSFWGGNVSGISFPPSKGLARPSAQDVGFTQLPHFP